MSWRQFGGRSAELPISTIIIDPAVQVRPVDEQHVERLEDQKKRLKAKLPRPWVMDVEGHGLLLVGGRHTFEVEKRAGKAKIAVQLKPGTYAEAMFTAARSNNDKSHFALPMSNAAKERAVSMALHANTLLPAKEQKSHRKIAEEIGVSHTKVNDMAALKEGRAKAKGGSSSTAADAEEKPAAKVKPAAKGLSDDVRADDWRAMSAGDALKLNLSSQNILDGLKLDNVGEIWDELEGGSTLGLNKPDLADLRRQIEALQGQTEAAAAGKPAPLEPFDWQGCHQAVGAALRRSAEAVVKSFGVGHKQDREYREIDAAFGVIFAQLRLWEASLGKKAK